jgi:hypothetical protein
MKKIVNFTLLLLFAALFFQCKDNDPILPPPPPCFAGLDSLTIPAINIDTMYPITCPFDGEIYPDRYKYSFPSFNPDNAEEIAFIRYDYQQGEWSLCILNFCSGELKVLTDKVLEDVDWGNGDWIVFTGKDHQIWKIKSNGEDLTRLTNSGENSHPIWNVEGSEVAYTQLGPSGDFYVIDENGILKDTILEMQYHLGYDWSSSDKFSTFTGGSDFSSYRPGYFDWVTGEFSFVDEVNEMNYIFDIEWSRDNDELYWIAKRKIAKTDIYTGIRTELVNIPFEVNSRYYESFTISPDFKYIVAGRENRKKVNDCDWEITQKLYIMNIDGTDERKILIPE